MTDFEIKDSGQRQTFESGMQRDTEEDKLDYLLTRDGPMYKRWAAHLTKGAKKYAPRNWMKATGEDELERAKRSFLRHSEQWLDGEVDEDHAAGIFFNVNQVEYIRAKMRAEDSAERPKVYCSRNNPYGIGPRPENEEIPSPRWYGGGGICARHGMYNGFSCPTCGAPGRQGMGDKPETADG